MSEFCEIKVKMKNDEGETIAKKFPNYNKITLAQDCPELASLVDETRQLFRGNVEEIIVTARYQWQ